MTTKLRAGIIGAGWPGQQHARAISAGKTAVLVALAEPNDERAAEFRRIYSPKQVYRDYADLLGDPRVDAVVICLPNHFAFPGDARHAPAPTSMCFVKSRRPRTAPRCASSRKKRSGGGALIDIGIHALDSARI